MVKREVSHLRSLARRVVSKETFRKIGRISDRIEKIDLYKYSIKSNLDMRIHNLEKEMKKHSKEHDIFHLIAKANLLNMKIKYFYISHDKKDLKRIIKILKEIEKEISRFTVDGKR